ncbi:MAG TPA: hypothetical protein VD816_13445 [Ohtaekwangia sp.]|nr:hypothetical protein [Ohtaekwangia sp.]
MKKVMMMTAGMLLMGIVAVNAQDSTQRTNPAQQPSQQPRIESQQQNQYRVEDRVSVTADELPSSLRQTLQNGSQYRGWENTPIYRDRTSQEYYFELNDGTNKTMHRFDRNGKTIEGNGNEPRGGQ